MKMLLNWPKQYIDFDWLSEVPVERLTVLGATLEATKWRERLARGVSRGLGVLFGISPGGAANRSIARLLSFAPGGLGLLCIHAHGVSRGLCVLFDISPGGAEDTSPASFKPLSPLRGSDSSASIPTADAVGYPFSPLRGSRSESPL
jgi:hypothetical protein